MMCFDGTLTMKAPVAKLTANMPSASLHSTIVACVLEHTGLHASLVRKSALSSRMTAKNSLAGSNLGGGAPISSKLLGREFVHCKADGKIVDGILKSNIPSAVLGKKDSVSASLSAKTHVKGHFSYTAIDGFFGLFCPIDYLVSCFTEGWNNDLGWDNDEGWDND